MNMKRIVALLLSAIVCVGLAACSGAPAIDTADTTAVTGSVTASGSSALLPLAQCRRRDLYGRKSGLLSRC